MCERCGKPGYSVMLFIKDCQVVIDFEKVATLVMLPDEAAKFATAIIQLSEQIEREKKLGKQEG
jgi:hypothetical protein